MKSIIVWFMMVWACSAFGQTKSDHKQYAGAMQASAKMYNLRKEACRETPQRGRAVCYARAHAEWSKAMANAKASYRNTPVEWARSKQIAREVDARTIKVGAQK
jgi:hypothetical protein